MSTMSIAMKRCVQLAGAAFFLLNGHTAVAQERLPWLREAPAPVRDYDRQEAREEREPVDRQTMPPPEPVPYNSAPRVGQPAYDAGGYRVPDDSNRVPPSRAEGYSPPRSDPRDDAYRPPARSGTRTPTAYSEPLPSSRRPDEPEWRGPDRQYGHSGRYASSEESRVYDRDPPPSDGTFSMNEIVGAGHGFFGSLSQGLASVIEHAFKTQGRPNGYILGEDVGGAFVAGLRYGQGRLYTRDAGSHKVYWQGPSIGYDAGAEGSKVMVLVYKISDPSDVYQRFGGVAGSAYVVGGVGLTFQQRDDIVLAPIRVGIGLRLGANVGYLKYTRRPTWNPF